VAIVAALRDFADRRPAMIQHSVAGLSGGSSPGQLLEQRQVRLDDWKPEDRPLDDAPRRPARPNLALYGYSK
jgi:hypothetical protein